MNRSRGDFGLWASCVCVCVWYTSEYLVYQKWVCLGNRLGPVGGVGCTGMMVSWFLILIKRGQWLACTAAERGEDLICVVVAFSSF